MSQLKSQLHEKDKHIKTTRIFAFLFFIIILVLAGVIYTFPSRLTIYNPPDLRAGSQRAWWEIPKPTIYAFSYQIFQQMNRWMTNGEEDYEKNITALKPFLTPHCEEFLRQDYKDRLRNNELRSRTRMVYEITGRGYSEDKVTVLSEDSWAVNLDLSVDEHFQGQPVKRVYIRFPVSIIRMDVDSSKNPWGLGFNCYNSIPKLLEGVEPKTEEKK